MPWLALFAQANPEVEFYTRLSRAFRGGLRSVDVYVAIGLFVLVLLALLGLTWAWREFRSPSRKKKGKRMTILDAIRKNVQLTDNQNRYLSALIEKFKNRHPHDPEVSTDYLRTFFRFAVQNLTHAPTQTLRRKTQMVPDLEIGHTMELMVERNDEYRTLKARIRDQNDEYVRVELPPDARESDLVSGELIPVYYGKGDLHMRGEARVDERDPPNALLSLDQGLHFEEQRTEKRVETANVPSRIHLEQPAGEPFTLRGTMVDVSIGGALVELRDDAGDVEADQRGHIEFDLPVYGAMDLDVFVVHVHDEEEPVQLGLQFMNTNADERETLQDYVHSQGST